MMLGSHPTSKRTTKITTRGRTSRPPRSFSVAKVASALLISVICIVFAASVAFLRTIEFNDSLAQPNTDTNKEQKQIATDINPSNDVLSLIQSVRDEFYRRYGGKEQARQLWNKGVTALGSAEMTAKRILRAAAMGEPFVLSFAGYSVTVGRGNHFSQSFPFVLERILQPVMEQMHVQVLVRNAAIGGIPSFPYAFCFAHFLGQDANVISWDFSMNEGKGTAVLESYIRHSQVQLPDRPMIILLDDGNTDRCKTIQRYIEQNSLADAICVQMPKNIVDPSMFKQKEVPSGFQHWDEFGAPKNCPGQGNWHPKKMEHEMIGWLIAVYFLEAIEVAYKIMTTEIEWHEKYRVQHVPVPTFGIPFSAPLPENGIAMTQILYGHEDNKLHHVSCRTNFLPAVDHDKTLPSIVVSGWNEKANADNIMEERTNDDYSAGWVLDVSSLERGTKVKVEKCGGLGYIDMKIAMYGIQASGTMRLWLPASGGSSHEGHDNEKDDSKLASHWFDEIVLCEANEKRGDDACKLDSDVEYTVGGVLVEAVRMVAGAGEYLKRRTCAHIEIPASAKVVSLKDLSSPDGQPLSSSVKQRLGGIDEQVGVVVDVKAKSHVTKADGACCISHVVWEQH